MGRVFTVLTVLAIAALILWGLNGKTPYQYSDRDDSSQTPRTGDNSQDEEKGGSVANQTSTKESRNPSSIAGVTQFFKDSYGGSWETITSSEGRIVTVLGGAVPGVGENDDRVLKWGKQVAPLFAVTPEQITSVELASESKFARHLYLSQKVGLFKVYNGGMQVSVNKKDNSIFQVNNSLREVGDFERNIRYNKAQDWTVVQGVFREKIERSDSNSQPVIHAESGADKSELAWVFQVKVFGEDFDVREVVIGAISGEVLENTKLLVH